MRFLLFAVLLFLQTTPMYAQSSCGTDAADQALRAANPQYDMLRQHADSIIKQATLNAAQTSGNGSSSIIVNGIHYIPIVVHVIHSGEPIGSTQNPSDLTITNYIAMLNQAFSGTYPGYPGPGTGGQNIGIQFVLAQRAPDCSPTNGIVRRNALEWLTPDKAAIWNTFGVNQGPALPFGLPFDDIAAMSNWPNLDYYNIYMVKKITGSNFAYYPTGTATIYDATVLSMLAVTGTSVSPYVISHEMGHAFGLRHTFQGAVGTTCPPNASCLTQGDMICDTEPVTDQVVACDPTAINPCTGQPFGDVVYNYMGAACHDRFTAGQNAHMNTVLTTLRWTLDTSLGGTSLALIPPTPAANTPTISISTPQTSYCTNSQVIITATATYAGANPVYQWKINGVNAGPNSPTFVSTTLNSGDVISCVLTSSYGATCVTTNTAVSNSITITISSTIAPSISITAANTTVCASTQVSITATALNQGPTIPFFQWYVNGFPYGPVTGNGSTTNVLTYYPSDGDVVTCKLLASTSCSPNPWYTSNAVTINTIPSIAPTIAISASDSTVCSGSTITLNATYTNGGTTTPTITWMILNSMAGAIGSGPGPITLVVDSSIQIAAMLNVNNTGGLCYYQTVSVSDWLQIIADTPVVASVLISTPDTMFCPGSALQFTATPVNGGVNPLYSWMVNGAPSGVNTGTFSLSPADNDVITTQLFSNAACVATSPVASNSLTVHELPQPPTPVVTDFGTYFSSNYPNGQNQWHAVGVGPLAGEVNQLFYPSFSGSFYDVVTTVGCASAPSDTLQFPGTNAVTGLSSPDEVFYPNPSGTGEFLTPAYLQGRQAVIINSIGKVIKALTLERKLTLNEVPAGVYLLKTEAAGGTKYFRLVVAR